VGYRLVVSWNTPMMLPWWEQWKGEQLY